MGRALLSANSKILGLAKTTHSLISRSHCLQDPTVDLAGRGPVLSLLSTGTTVCLFWPLTIPQARILADSGPLLVSILRSRDPRLCNTREFLRGLRPVHARSTRAPSATTRSFQQAQFLD